MTAILISIIIHLTRLLGLAHTPAPEAPIPDPTPIDITCDEFEVRGRVDCVDGYSGTNYASFEVLDHLPCAEDEVAVPRDNSSHEWEGLRWECLHIDDLDARGY